MAVQGFTIQLDDVEVKKKIQTMVGAVNSFEKPLIKIGDEMLKTYGGKVFKDQGANGDKWKPLSAATLLMRKKRQGHYALPPIQTRKILIWTGAMMKGFVKKVTRVKLTISNRVPYFEHNQKSQRKMLYINKDITHMVVTFLADHIKKSLK